MPKGFVNNPEGSKLIDGFIEVGRLSFGFYASHKGPIPAANLTQRKFESDNQDTYTTKYIALFCAANAGVSALDQAMELIWKKIDRKHRKIIKRVIKESRVENNPFLSDV